MRCGVAAQAPGARTYETSMSLQSRPGPVVPPAGGGGRWPDHPPWTPAGKGSKKGGCTELRRGERGGGGGSAVPSSQNARHEARHGPYATPRYPHPRPRTRLPVPPGRHITTRTTCERRILGALAGRGSPHCGHAPPCPRPSHLACTHVRHGHLPISAPLPCLAAL